MERVVGENGVQVNSHSTQWIFWDSVDEFKGRRVCLGQFNCVKVPAAHNQGKVS